MASAITASAGAATISATSATATDTTRLSVRCRRLTRKPSPKTSALGESDSTASRPVRRS